MRKVAKFKIMCCQIARHYYYEDSWPSLFFDKRSNPEGDDILDRAGVSARRIALSQKDGAARAAQSVVLMAGVFSPACRQLCLRL
jgi:hypothetical protein